MSLVRSLRLPEALLVSCFTFAGVLLSAPDGAALGTGRAAVFLLASYLLIVSIYAFNSWGGAAEDAVNPRLAGVSDASPRAFLAASLLTLCAALALFFSVALRTAPYAVAVWALWGVYSFPRRGAKYAPPAGTLVHVAVGVAQFHQGWTLFGAPGMRSLLLSLFFAAALAAGHINHELIDREADRSAGVASGAVRFGVRAWTALHLIAALASCALAVAVVFHDPALCLRFAPFAIASAGHALSALLLCAAAPRDALPFLRHRARYRLLYGVAGLAALLLVVLP